MLEMFKYLILLVKKFLQEINNYYLQINGKKIIFYHIPRTSGTSIKFFFIKYFGEKKILGQNDYNTFNEVDLKNKNILFGHKLYSNLNLKNKHEFTILRDPIKRELSLYNYYMNYNDANKHKLPKDSLIKNLNISFRDYTNIIKNNFQDNIVTRFFSNKYPIKDFNLFYSNKENNFISLEERLEKLKSKNVSEDDYILSDQDYLKAIKNLNSINVYILEKFDRKKLYNNFGTLIHFNDNIYVNKSISSEILDNESEKLITSINKFDLKIYEFFKNK